MKKLVLMGTLLVASWIDSPALTTVEIVAKVKPAIVMVNMYNENNQPTGFGTGFFINSNQVVTNSHVIAAGKYVGIVDLSGTYYNLERVVAANPTFDLGILQTRQNSKASWDMREEQRLSK